MKHSIPLDYYFQYFEIDNKTINYELYDNSEFTKLVKDIKLEIKYVNDDIADAESIDDITTISLGNIEGSVDWLMYETENCVEHCVTLEGKLDVATTMINELMRMVSSRLSAEEQDELEKSYIMKVLSSNSDDSNA